MSYKDDVREYTMEKTKKIILFSVLLFVGLLALVLGTIFDLQISQAIAVGTGFSGGTDLFTMFFETVGEDILYLLVASAFAVIIWYCRKVNKNKLRIFLQILFFFLGFLILFFGAHRTLEYIGEHMGEVGVKEMAKPYVLLIKMTVALVLNVFIILSFKVCKDETINKLFKWAIVVIVAAAVSNLIVQGFKIIWGRQRFYSMKAEGSFEGFSYWFAINGKRAATAEQIALGLSNDIYKSFPSGHTCAATSIFLITLLPSFLSELNNKKSKVALWSIASIYTFAVGLSRIVLGAHFFTDVYISFLITFGVIILVNWFITKDIYKKLVKKTNRPKDENKA